MKSEQIDVSVVVPLYNKQNSIEKTLESIARTENLSVEVIVVDDCSTDNSFEIVESLSRTRGNLKLFRHPFNKGAGIARNTGLREASGSYVLFFDADDRLLEKALEMWRDVADAHAADIVVCKYALVGGPLRFSKKMSAVDEGIWSSVLGEDDTHILDVRKNPEFLRTANFPWNKLYRRAFLEHTEFGFSDTWVQNDVYAHWSSMVSSSKTVLTKHVFCEHFIGFRDNQLTNIVGQERLEIFPALEETLSLLLQCEEHAERYLHHYILFCINLLKWAAARIPAKHSAEFMHNVKRLCQLAGPEICARYRQNAPEVYDMLGRMSVAPETVVQASRFDKTVVNLQSALRSIDALSAAVVRTFK
jgi:glycosyltransferase involved in cell wall biosynthesis